MSQASSTMKAPAQQSLISQGRAMLTGLNLHFAGIGLLALINLYLLIHMGFAWQAERSQNAAALAQQAALVHAADHAAAPLRGLDGKLTLATENANSFYQRRLPFAYSQVLAELGALAKKQNVKLNGVQYAQSPVLEGAVGEATEVRMDARLSGDYRPLVIFMNSLERDRMFFYISSVTLTGQQSGTVNLRIKLTTYLRAPVGTESTSKAVALNTGGPATSTPDGRATP